MQSACLKRAMSRHDHFLLLALRRMAFRRALQAGHEGSRDNQFGKAPPAREPIPLACTARKMTWPSAGRIFRAVLSRLCSWGIPRGYCKSNPVEHTETSEEGGTYDPWPPNAFEHFFAHARFGLHLPVYSGLFTGQRLSDVIVMRRPVEDVTEMPLVAQKTGELVPVRIHSEYRGIIRAQKPVMAASRLTGPAAPQALLTFSYV